MGKLFFSRPYVQILSVVEEIDIAEIHANRVAVLASSFNPGEREVLNKRHIRSTAGVLALKRALSFLAQQLTGCFCAEKDFSISRHKSGRPILISWPETLAATSFQQQNLFLSISHSQKTAYGLAVFQEEQDD